MRRSELREAASVCGEMRRWLGRIFCLPAGLSALFCLAIIALWVRGYWVSDDVTRAMGNQAKNAWSWTFFHSGRGRVVLVRHTIDYWPGLMHDADGVEWERTVSKPSADLPAVANPGTGLPQRHFAGIWHEWRDWPVSYGVDRVDCWGIPLAWLAGVTAVLPGIGAVVFLTKRRRRGRVKRGLCPVCGYDVRATPTRCPECGTVLARAAGDL